jgi:hypothetical protein
MNITNEARFNVETGPVAVDSTRTIPKSVSQVGFWAAVLATIFSLGYGISVIVMMVSMLATVTDSPSGWGGIETFIASFQPVQMLPLIPSLFLAPAFIVLMVSVHYYAAPDKKIWSHLGIAFTLIYATMAAMNYMVQLIPVWRSISNGEADGLAMFVLGNPHSMFWGLAYAYIFMNLAMLLTAPVFEGTPLERWIRLLFILNGVSGVFTIVWIFFDSPPFYLLGSLVLWCPVFTAATASTALLFLRVAKAERKP